VLSLDISIAYPVLSDRNWACWPWVSRALWSPTRRPLFRGRLEVCGCTL